MNCAAATLGGCGGGTSQVEPFKPARLVAFGDEASVIVDDGLANGRKYSINGLNASLARDCGLLPIWTQTLATHYGFVFAECNKAAATPQAFVRAKAGARVDDPETGIARQVADMAALGGVRADDLVTVLMGANDIVDLVDRVRAGTLTSSDALVEARRRGATLAAGVNTLLGGGARAIVSTTPDMGLSPYVRTLDQTTPGTAQLATQLTYEFNASLRTGIDQTRFDGRNYGLVLTDNTVQAVAKAPGLYSNYPGNVTTAACVVALPQCTTAAADLVAEASSSSHMWADDRRLGPSLHELIGSQALSRAVNNPF